MILLATAVPARAASGDSYVGMFIHVNNLSVTNSNTGGTASGNFELQYNVYGSGAFNDSVTQDYQAAAAPSFATWTFSYHYEVYDSTEELAYSSPPVNVTLAQGATEDVTNDSIQVGQTGSFTVRLVITSSQVSTANGESFINVTPDAVATVTIT